MHDLKPLVDALHKVVKRVALETNGTRQLDRSERLDWVAVSPKWPPGCDGLKQKYAQEIKVPVYQEVSNEDIIKAMYKVGSFHAKFLQPIADENWQANVSRALHLAYKTGARISGQIHKRLGIA